MPMTRDDAAGLIGNAIGALTDDLNHLAKGSYDADAHNPCFAYVELADGSDRTLFAYSDSSKMNKNLKGFYEIPPSTSYLDHFGLGKMQAAHTEPKLLNVVLNTFTQGQTHFTHVTLVTSRDPCSSCQKVINRFKVMYPGSLTVHGFAAQTGGGVPDLSGTIFA